MTTDLPAVSDVPGWRGLLAAAPDRAGRVALVRAWAGAAGCVVGQGDDHLIHPPLDIPAPVHGALAHHAVVNGLFVTAPTPLPGWVPGPAS